MEKKKLEKLQKKFESLYKKDAFELFELKQKLIKEIKELLTKKEKIIYDIEELLKLKKQIKEEG